MARPRLPEEMKRAPFRATVSPQDRRWLEAHVGQGRRWASTSALLADAIVLLRDFEVAEGNVRQEFLQMHVENLRRLQAIQKKIQARISKVGQAPESAPVSSEPVEVPQGGRPVEYDFTRLDGAASLAERYGIDSATLERLNSEHRNAVARRDWAEAQELASFLGHFDEVQRLIFEGPQGRIYQQGTHRFNEPSGAHGTQLHPRI